jgi:hypothetical protein
VILFGVLHSTDADLLCCCLLQPRCAEWAKSGECTNNPDFMAVSHTSRLLCLPATLACYTLACYACMEWALAAGITCRKAPRQGLLV